VTPATKLDPAALLADLVRIPSPSGDEGRAADHVAALLADAGVDCERIGSSLLARIERGSGPTLLLNSHLDTVPAGPSWNADPFRGEWDGDRLVGLGANDAGAAAVGMLAAALRFASEPDARGTLLLALTACEETSNAGMADVLARCDAIDGAITGEPTGLEVVRAQAGLAVLVASWSGVSCHAAHAARVEHSNALLTAAADLAALPSAITLPGEHALLGASTLVPTVLTAGERHNRVPDLAECVFDGRLAPPHDAAECVATLSRRLPNAELRVRSERLVPVETAADHPLVAAALRAAGRDVAIGSNTLSDMALLAGVPAVKCGPGETARSHTPDEYVLRAELDAGVAFYARAVPDCLEALATSAGRAS
jgi:acetylornithine deacetylase